MGPPFRPHRPVVEGCIFRLRAGIPWRDVSLGRVEAPVGQRKRNEVVFVKHPEQRLVV
jgi:hypothetical protein